MSLPTFIIGGERRCGTTSLVRWMSTHPDIYIYPQADPSYFCDDDLVGTRVWQDGKVDQIKWEQNHTPNQYADLFRQGQKFKSFGEKTADYLFWQPAHARLAQFLPKTKFIFTLRHPVERAWSQYWNEFGKGRETLSFAEALAIEAERCEKSDYAKYHLAYKERSCYDTSLKHFLRFFPLEQVLVVTLEQSRAEPIKTLQQIYHFLEVDDSLGLKLGGSKHNENRTKIGRAWTKIPPLSSLEQMYARYHKGIIRRLTSNQDRQRKIQQLFNSIFYRSAAKEKMSIDIRRQLNLEFAPHITNLEGLLDREFPEWK